MKYMNPQIEVGIFDDPRTGSVFNWKYVGIPIIEYEPIQTDLQAALSNFNASPIEDAPVITDAEALSE